MATNHSNLIFSPDDILLLSTQYKNNAAASNPTATDDGVAGYGVGSLWVNTASDTAYICQDTTTSAAVWTQISATGTEVLETLYDAQTLLVAVADNTPLPVVVNSGEFVGRPVGGDLGSMTAAQARTALNVEDGATADQTDSEIETAYNNQVPQVSAGEITAGTETNVRRFSPADVKSVVDTHGGGGAGETAYLDSAGAPTVKNRRYYHEFASDGGSFNLTGSIGSYAKGEWIEIVDMEGSASTNNITVTDSVNPSHTFNGVAGDYILNTDYASARYVSTGVAGGWIVIPLG